MAAGSRLRSWPTAVVVVIGLTAGIRAAVDITGRSVPLAEAAALALAPVCLAATVLRALAGADPPLWRRRRRRPPPRVGLLRVGALRDRLDVGARSGEQYRRAVHPVLVAMTRDRLARTGHASAPPGVLRDLLEQPPPDRALRDEQVAAVVSALEQL